MPCNLYLACLKFREPAFDSLHKMRLAIIFLVCMIKLERITRRIDSLCDSRPRTIVCTGNFRIAVTQARLTIAQKSKLDRSGIGKLRGYSTPTKRERNGVGSIVIGAGLCGCREAQQRHDHARCQEQANRASNFLHSQ